MISIRPLAPIVRASLLATIVMLACTADDVEEPTDTPSGSSGAGSSAALLTSYSDIAEAVDAAAYVLSSSGVALVDIDGREVFTPSFPRSSVTLLAGELPMLAIDARHRATAGRMTLDEFASMLEELGWPFLVDPFSADPLASPTVFDACTLLDVATIEEVVDSSIDDSYGDGFPPYFHCTWIGEDAEANLSIEGYATAGDLDQTWAYLEEDPSMVAIDGLGDAAISSYGKLHVRSGAWHLSISVWDYSGELSDEAAVDTAAILAAEALERLVAAPPEIVSPDQAFPTEFAGTPGDQLKQFLASWIEDTSGFAADDPAAVAPRFLAEMAMQQVPAVDLSQPDSYAPADLRLTLIELLVFTSSIERHLAADDASLASSGAQPGVSRTEPIAFVDPDFCTNLKNQLAAAARPVAGEAAKQATSAGISGALKLGGVSSDNAASVRKGLKALVWASKVLRVVSLLAQGEVWLEPRDGTTFHMTAQGDDPRTVAPRFDAIAGVKDEDWEAYQESIASADAVRVARDCLKLAGFPPIPDLGDIAAEAEKWRVSWQILGNDYPTQMVEIRRDLNPGFAEFGAGLGTLKMPLVRSGDHSATATLRLLVLDERGGKYGPHTGDLYQGSPTVRASLDMSALPSEQTIFDWAKGILSPSISEITKPEDLPTKLTPQNMTLELTNATLDLLGNFVLKIWQPKAYVQLDVELHDDACLCYLDGLPELVRRP